MTWALPLFVAPAQSLPARYSRRREQARATSSFKCSKHRASVSLLISFMCISPLQRDCAERRLSTTLPSLRLQKRSNWPGFTLARLCLVMREPDILVKDTRFRTSRGLQISANPSCRFQFLCRSATIVSCSPLRQGPKYTGTVPDNLENPN